MVERVTLANLLGSARAAEEALSIYGNAVGVLAVQPFELSREEAFGEDSGKLDAVRAAETLRGAAVRALWDFHKGGQDFQEARARIAQENGEPCQGWPEVGAQARPVSPGVMACLMRAGVASIADVERYAEGLARWRHDVRREFGAL